MIALPGGRVKIFAGQRFYRCVCNPISRFPSRQCSVCFSVSVVIKCKRSFFEFCYKEEHCMGPYDTRNMELHEKQGVAYLTFPAFSAVSFVRHAFSTRVGGVSRGEFSSMNLSFHRGDPDETVLTNYHRFCDAAGFSFDSLVLRPRITTQRSGASPSGSAASGSGVLATGKAWTDCSRMNPGSRW